MIRQDLHDSLKNACRAAIKHGNSLENIRVPKWAETFGCSPEHIMKMWEHEQSKLSREASNSFEVQDD